MGGVHLGDSVRRPSGRAERAARSREVLPEGGAMVYTLSYQMYKCEHGLRAAEQRAADVRAGEAAAAVRDLRLGLGRALRARRSRRAGGRTADAITASAP